MCYDGLPSCSSFACDHGPFRPAKQETRTARCRISQVGPTICVNLGCAQGHNHHVTQVTQSILERLVDVLNVKRNFAVFEGAKSSRPSREHLLLHKLLELQTMMFQALQEVCNILSHDQADSCIHRTALSEGAVSAEAFGRGVGPVFH